MCISSTCSKSIQMQCDSLLCCSACAFFEEVQRRFRISCPSAAFSEILKIDCSLIRCRHVTTTEVPVLKVAVQPWQTKACDGHRKATPSWKKNTPLPGFGNIHLLNAIRASFMRPSCHWDISRWDDITEGGSFSAGRAAAGRRMESWQREL